LEWHRPFLPTSSSDVCLAKCINVFRHAPPLLHLLLGGGTTCPAHLTTFAVATVFRVLASHAALVPTGKLLDRPDLTKPVLDLLSAHQASNQEIAAVAFASCLRVSSSPEVLLETIAKLLASSSSYLDACLRMLVEGKEAAVMPLLRCNVGLVEGFLRALLAHATSEAHFPRVPDPSLGHLALSADLQLLLLVQRVLFSTSKLRSMAAFYVNEAFGRCCALAAGLLPQSSEDRAKCSFLALVLPSLIATLSRAPLVNDFSLVESMQPQLLHLVKALDALALSVPAVAKADAAYLNRVQQDKAEDVFRAVVESQHPYTRGRNQLQQTVTVPGAKSIALHFDPKCRTLSMGNDMLQLFLTPSLSAPVLGPDKNGLVYSGQHWPKQKVVIEGNTVTFLFSAASRNLEDPGVSLAQRWGFKCVVTEYKEAVKVPGTIEHWLLDLINSTSLLCARQAAALLAGEPTSVDEQRCQVWLSSRHFTGGRDESASSSPENSFLHSLAETAAPHPLYVWLKSKQRRMASPQAAVFLEQAERLLLAAMLKHLGLVRDAMDFCNQLRAGADVSNSPHVGKLLAIGDETLKTFKWLMERGQLENQWLFAVADRKADTTDFHDLPPEKLKTLCKMKRVPFSLMKIEDTHRHLLDRLRQDIESSEQSPHVPQPNPHETVCRPVIERARFLLQLLPTQKVVDYPSAVSNNPFAAGLVRSQLQLEGSLDSQQVELMIEDSGADQDDSSFTNMPLFRSASYFPKTDTAKDQALLKEKNELKSKEFTRRVKELRQWLDAYTSWKSWRQGVLLDTVRGTGQTPLPRSPIPAISSFVKSDLKVSFQKKFIYVSLPFLTSWQRCLRCKPS
jgi:hypothetical protein